MKFTRIPEMKYPPSHKAKLSQITADIINEFCNSYKGTFKERRSVVTKLNSVIYHVISGDTISDINSLSEVDDDECKQVLGALYLNDKKIDWDIQIVESDTDSVHSSTEASASINRQESKPSVTTKVSNTVMNSSVSSDKKLSKVTPKTDLYLKPPVIPIFDSRKIYAQGVVDGTLYVVYHSMPYIPKCQNEISVTTDVNDMTVNDLLLLFPNTFIQTRSSIMYDNSLNLYKHEKLGTVFPIKGFTNEQILDNIIKYPHIFRLTKSVEGKAESFYSTIEIDGELHKVSNVWSKLEDAKNIPYTTDFVKEYVVRKYLLERDVLGIRHKYPMIEDLRPFLTLFMPSHDYVELGYADAEELAKQCVISRVAYKKSKNPVLRRLLNA